MTDAVVVGAGPNGLAAAVTLARAGLAVEVFEANDTIGGAARTLDRDGTRHDWGSAVHPMALASPFFQAFELERRMELVVPPASFAQAMDTASPVAWRDLARTVEGLGAEGASWRRLLGPLSVRAAQLAETALAPMVPMPRHPAVAMRLALAAAGTGLPAGPHLLRGERSRALLAGVVAHTVRPMPSLASAAPGLVLAALAHAGGWPVPVGGSQAIVDALVADLRAHGGVIHTGTPVRSLTELPAARAYLFDTSAPALVRLAGARLTPRYRRALVRQRRGDAASKVDFTLSGPIPWRDADLAHTATVHLGGRWEDIARAEHAVARGRHAAEPYVLLAQPSLFDATRSAHGHETAWTYAHVPAGSDRDMTEAVTARIERYAPGFRDLIISAHATPATEIQLGDANLIGGDIASGAITLPQLIARPTVFAPWRAGSGIYLCSSAAVPGPGVHGMVGFHAARSALRDVFALPVPSLARD